jgi:hypothetical protein
MIVWITWFEVTYWICNYLAYNGNANLFKVLEKEQKEPESMFQTQGSSRLLHYLGFTL